MVLIMTSTPSRATDRRRNPGTILMAVLVAGFGVFGLAALVFAALGGGLAGWLIGGSFLATALLLGAMIALFAVGKSQLGLEAEGRLEDWLAGFRQGPWGLVAAIVVFTISAFFGAPVSSAGSCMGVSSMAGASIFSSSCSVMSTAFSTETMRGNRMISATMMT